MDKSRISAITDEIGLSTDEAIAFAHQYGLQFVEIRNPPGSRKEYFTLSEPEIKADALRFRNEGLKVSFVNTSLLKFGWPGERAGARKPEEPAAREKRLAAEKARWDRRMEDLQKALRCAQIMGADKVRVFTGSRVDDPTSHVPAHRGDAGRDGAGGRKGEDLPSDRKRSLAERGHFRGTGRHHEAHSLPSGWG